MQRNSPGAARDGGSVMLRPVRATPCLNIYEDVTVVIHNDHKKSLSVCANLSDNDNIGTCFPRQCLFCNNSLKTILIIFGTEF